MDKERFNKIIKDYSHLHSQNEDLEKLLMKFPYSQPVRMLNVKSSSKLSKIEYQQRIALAAFYTTDRNVLRSLIEKGKVPSDFENEVVRPLNKQIKTVNKLQIPAKKIEAPEPKTKSAKPVDATHLREEVLANLEILQQTKSSFWQLFELDNKAEKKIKKTPAKRHPVAEAVTKKKALKPGAPMSAKKVRMADNSPKAKKNELIDKFIANKPSITRGKERKEKHSDLSKESGELKEDLVSENLAIIFAKQGKSGKAIEIYKRLIWKFPQKKASFAARIEELKKK